MQLQLEELCGSSAKCCSVIGTARGKGSLLRRKSTIYICINNNNSNDYNNSSKNQHRCHHYQPVAVGSHKLVILLNLLENINLRGFVYIVTKT